MPKGGPKTPRGVFSMKMRDELIARLVSENENFQHQFNSLFQFL